jgi:hypothetical protein
MKLFTVFALAVLVCASAHAAFLTPIGATSPNAADGQAPLSSIINHYGLADGGTHTATYRDGTTYYHWRTQESPNTVSVTFDLGARFDLDQMRIWNYNEDSSGTPQTTRGIKDMTVSFSNDGTTFGAAQDFMLGKASARDTYAGEDVTFSGLGIGYRYIKFDVITNHGSGFATGLSEVRFNTTTAELTPTSVSVNQTADGNAKFTITNIWNDSGMIGFGDEMSAVFSGGTDSGKLWRQQEGVDGNSVSNSVITFDFGEKKNIGAVKIWNYHEEWNETYYNDRGIKTIDLYQSDDGSAYTYVDTYEIGQQLNQTGSVLHTVLDLYGEDVNAHYLQIRGVEDLGSTYYGLGEVRFYEAAIPEPSTLALLMGVGGLAAFLRRRSVGRGV